MKRLYEIALPMRANDGSSYRAAHERFADWALSYAGGVTIFPKADGVWQDEKLPGVVYHDKMVAYRVHCDLGIKNALVTMAMTLFHDQVAIFVSDVGTAEIVYRSDHDKPCNDPNWGPGNRAQVRREANKPW